MTISKQRLNEIALEVACELDLENPLCDVNITWLNGFALALIRRVEAESITVDVHNNQVVYVPLVSEGRP